MSFSFLYMIELLSISALQSNSLLTMIIVEFVQRDTEMNCSCYRRSKRFFKMIKLKPSHGQNCKYKLALLRSGMPQDETSIRVFSHHPDLEKIMNAINSA
mmetsp:Transcript_13428/g.20416  ORF Transcript_13428/g.20416 Transcript_13428/m.20416 type:complete len:100 (+) Transcript_13428:378-677(+)